MTTPQQPMTSLSSSPDVPTTVPQSTSGAATDRQISDLAGQINKPALPYDPARPRKGIVTAIDLGDASSAPTCTVFLSGDETVPIPGVRLASDYSPQIGDMVILLQQGVEFFALCSIATVGSVTSSSAGGGWTKAVLNTGHSHNGNSNGDVMYRRVLEDGCWKMQWKGALNYGGNTTMLLTNLPTEFHPANKHSAICPRDVNTSGGVGIGLDFQVDGGVTVIAANWTTNSSSHTHDVSGNTDSVDPGDFTTTDSTPAHSHGVVGSHSHGWGNNTTSTGHNHTASNPTWIGLTGVEYFL